MRRFIITAVFCLGLAAAHVTAWAWPTNSVKVNPHGVDYPLIRPIPYPMVDLDPYERSFGVRRWLHFAGSEINDFRQTYDETRKWFDLYGGYGVLGHGEAVFTNAAAHWRKMHRGRE